MWKITLFQPFWGISIRSKSIFCEIFNFLKRCNLRKVKKVKISENFDFFQVLAPKIDERGILSRKIAWNLKLDPPLSRIWHFSVSETIRAIIYLHFWLIYHFSKIEVRARMSILGPQLDLIDYFDLGGIYWFLGYISSPTGPFLNFWILRS